MDGSGRTIEDISCRGEEDWVERCTFWTNIPVEKRGRGRRPRQRHVPLVITGHGMGLRINNGALVVRHGFTHHPQALKELRFFPGAPNLPSRIVVLDGSGSLSFDVMDWLAEQGIPLIRIDWRGNVVTALTCSHGLERIPVTFKHSPHDGRSSCILVG
jgi:CRISPR-associated protein Cas1